MAAPATVSAVTSSGLLAGGVDVDGEGGHVLAPWRWPVGDGVDQPGLRPGDARAEPPKTRIAGMPAGLHVPAELPSGNKSAVSHRSAWQRLRRCRARRVQARGHGGPATVW